MILKMKMASMRMMGNLWRVTADCQDGSLDIGNKGRVEDERDEEE